jgi:O-antigen/teichoic acid export membrane protein
LSRKNLSLYYGGYALGRAGSVASLPVVSRLLGTGGFGRFEAYLALMMLGTIVLDAGAGTTIVRFFGDEKQRRDSLVRAAAAVQSVASLLTVGAIGGPMLAIAAPGEGPTLVVVLAAFATVEGLAVLGAALLRVQGRDTTFFAMSVVRFALTLAGGAAGATVGPDLALLGVAVGGIGFAGVALLEVRRSGRAPVGQAVRRFIRYGVPLIGTTAMTWCLGVSDRLFLKAFDSSSTLGQYAANYRLGGVIGVFLASPLMLAWLPTARATSGVELPVLRARWSRRYAVAALGATATLTALSPVLVPAVFGGSFHDDRLVVAAAGLAGWLLGQASFIATPILLRDDTRVLALVAVVTAAVGLAANAALIPFFGAHGAALATLIGYLALCAATSVAVGGIITGPRMGTRHGVRS